MVPLPPRHGTYSSVVEHGFAEPGVAGSTPAVSSTSNSYIRHGVVGNISACHAEARGSIPRVGVFFFSGRLQLTYLNSESNREATIKDRA